MNAIKVMLLNSVLVPGIGLIGMLLAGALPALAEPPAGQQPSAAPPSNPAPPPNLRIRGAVTAFDGHVLRVKTREGKALKLSVPADARINVLSPLHMSDIKPGSFVGVTAVLSAGALRALEVHVFPEAMRGTGEGHYDWDLAPGSTMTNANVDAIVTGNNGETLKLSYQGGSQEILVPPNTPIITFTPATRSLLKRRAQVFIIARQEADGKLAALRILVGKGALKPPM